jgi:hypothetical protein
MKTTQDIGIIDNECFNTIFLCKSSTWIPAFLDHEFDRLMDFIIAMFKQTVIVNDTRIFNRIQQFNLSHEYLSELVKRSE